MPNATLPLTSFTGGEWSPRLQGRVDIAKYSTACEILQNMVIYPHGGITRRMGLEYIEDARVAKVRLIPFEYNREQAYVLEFSAGIIRFFRDGAQLAPGSIPLSVSTSYLEEELDDISFAQSNDVLYLVHENHHPMMLQRTGADTFTFTRVPFVNTGAPSGAPYKTPSDWIRVVIIAGLPDSYSYKYPRTVTLFQSRLVFGGIKNMPQTIWMSKAFDLYNFTEGGLANDPKTWTLSSTQNNAIQWLVPGSKLMIGTTGGEFSLALPDNAVNVQVLRESNYGSKNGRTQLIGNGVIYSSRDGRKLREMTYSFEADGFISPELSLLSEHLTRPGIKEFDYAQNPDGILWTVMSDGSFSGLTYLKSQEVQGWHRHQTQGEVVSVCTIEGDTGSEVWFAVSRNGATRIERMAPAFDGDSPNDLACAYLDSYLTYDGVAVSNLSGLDHLEGMEVSVLADGYYLSDKTVVGGSITLERPSSRIIVGLKYEWRTVPLRLEGGSASGLSQGKKKRVVDLIARLERSAGIQYKIPGRDFTSLIPSREYGQNYGEPITFFSGDKPIKLPNSWDREGQFELKGDSPFPVTILMIAANITVNE